MEKTIKNGSNMAAKPNFPRFSRLFETLLLFFTPSKVLDSSRFIEGLNDEPPVIKSKC